MTWWQKVRVCLLVGLLSLTAASGAWAARVSGNLSTVFEWFDTGTEDTALAGYQYLQLYASDIADKGYDIRLYGRVAGDFANNADVDSRLYTAYVAKRDLVDGLDVRLGRQFLSTTAGASVFDGVYLSYDKLGPLKAEVFGGGDVKYNANYSADDIVIGGRLSGVFLQNLSLGLSAIEKFDRGDPSYILYGFDANYKLDRLADIYNETQYDYLSNRISYFLLGTSVHPTQEWTARVEYLYSLPVFASTSIYSVFAVDEYQQAQAELSWRFAEGLRAYGTYTHEFYKEFSDADVLEAGVEKIRTTDWAGYAALTLRNDDDGQDLYGVKLYGSYLFSEKIQAGAGANMDVLERRLDVNGDQTDQTVSQRYWVDATYYFTRKVSLQGKVEMAKSDLWDHYFRGRVRLNVQF